MSFELKNTDVLVGYNDTTNEYTFNLSGVKRKKIASRRLPVLLNMNKFSSVGKGLLEINDLIKPDPFDSWYTVRGAIAEHFAQHELRRYIRDTKGVEITKLLAFNPREANYDQFKYNEFFGGVIDIAIQEPQSLRSVAEVKSKSLKNMSYITEDNIPQEELYQGFLLAYLSKAPTLYMVYVFFNEEQETKIKELTKAIQKSGSNIDDAVDNKLHFILKKLDIGYRDLEYKVFEKPVNEKTMDFQMEKAKKLVLRFTETGKVYKLQLAPEEVIYLNNLLGIDGTAINFDDLPF